MIRYLNRSRSTRHAIIFSSLHRQASRSLFLLLIHLAHRALPIHISYLAHTLPVFNTHKHELVNDPTLVLVRTSLQLLVLQVSPTPATPKGILLTPLCIVRCESQWYCSPAHLEEDWPRHKSECGALAAAYHSNSSSITVQGEQSVRGRRKVYSTEPRLSQQWSFRLTTSALGWCQ